MTKTYHVNRHVLFQKQMAKLLMLYLIIWAFIHIYDFTLGEIRTNPYAFLLIVIGCGIAILREYRFCTKWEINVEDDRIITSRVGGHVKSLKIDGGTGFHQTLQFIILENGPGREAKMYIPRIFKGEDELLKILDKGIYGE